MNPKPPDRQSPKNPRAAIRRLHAVTLLRSMGQGAALTITSLYLRELGWSGSAIGAVLAGSGIVRAGLSLFAGELSARLGPKKYLLVYEALTIAAVLAAALTSAPWLLASAVIAAGLGSGHSGSGGPTAPIERVWLGAYVKDKRKTQSVFGANALFGYAGLGAGALLACVPALLYGSAEGIGSYRIIYLLITIITACCMFCIYRLQGGSRKPRTAAVPSSVSGADPDAISTAGPSSAVPSGTAGEAAALRTKSAKAALRQAAASQATVTHAALPTGDQPRLNRRKLAFRLASVIGALAAAIGGAALLRHAGLRTQALFVPVAFFLLLLAASNYKLVRKPQTAQESDKRSADIQLLASVLSGVTATLTSTVTSYWFAERFGASPGPIGLVMGASYLAAALLAHLTSGVKDRKAAMRVILGLQLTAIALLLALPWITSFPLAAIIEIGCTACNFGTRGSRTAVMMEDRMPGKRSLAGKLNLLIVRLTAVLWPGAFVQFVDEGLYAPPFILAAAFQAGAAFLFGRAYRHDRRSEANAGATPSAVSAPASEHA